MSKIVQDYAKTPVQVLKTQAQIDAEARAASKRLADRLAADKAQAKKDAEGKHQPFKNLGSLLRKK